MRNKVIRLLLHVQYALGCRFASEISMARNSNSLGEYMKKLLCVLVISISFPIHVFASDDGKCEDYRSAIKSFCKNKSGAWKDGSAGACLGAQIGYARYNC